jgi:hypothetical protein
MVNGRLLLDEGRHTTVDLEKLRAEAEAGANHVHARGRGKTLSAAPLGVYSG